MPLTGPATRSPYVPGSETDAAVAIESSLENWIRRIDFLKGWLNRKPDLQTPELKLLTNADWFYATLGNPLSNEEELIRALRILNNAAITTRNSL